MIPPSRNIRVLRRYGGSRKTGGYRNLKRANCYRYKPGGRARERALLYKNFFSRKISVYSKSPLEIFFVVLAIYTPHSIKYRYD